MIRLFICTIILFYCYTAQYSNGQMPFDEVLKSSEIVVTASPIMIEYDGTIGRALMEVEKCYKGYIPFPFTFKVQWDLNRDEQYIRSRATCLFCFSGNKTDTIYHLSGCRYWQVQSILPSVLIGKNPNEKIELPLREKVRFTAVVLDVCPSSIQWPAEITRLEIENKPSYYYRKKQYTALLFEDILTYIEKTTTENK